MKLKKYISNFLGCNKIALQYPVTPTKKTEKKEIPLTYLLICHYLTRLDGGAELVTQLRAGNEKT